MTGCRRSCRNIRWMNGSIRIRQKRSWDGCGCGEGRMKEYQKLKDKFIMKNAWEDWASYRDQLTDLIVGLLTEMQSHVPADMGSAEVTIIGAGRCNDVDLLRLVASAGNVLLLDIDKEAVQEAVLSLPEDLQRKVEYRVATITGINEDDLGAFCDNMLSFARLAGRKLNVEAFRRQLMTGMDSLAVKLVREKEDLLNILPKASTDVLVCCGVCSQFFSMLSFFIRSLLHSLNEIVADVKALENEVNERIRRMDDQVIPAINRAFRCAARTAIVFGNEYMPGRPVEGAHQCIEDVRKSFRPEEKTLKWTFNRTEGISYDMLTQICRL